MLAKEVGILSVEHSESLGQYVKRIIYILMKYSNRESISKWEYVFLLISFIYVHLFHICCINAQSHLKDS